MAVPQAKTFKLKTRTNMQIPPQIKAAFTQQPAAQQQKPIPMPVTTQPLPENLTGKPVFVPYQHIPPNQQAKAMGQQQQQGVKTQQAPIQGKLIQRPAAAPVASQPPRQPPAAPAPQYAPPPPPPPPPQYQQNYMPPPAARPPQQPVSPQEYQQHHQHSPFTPPVGEAQELDPEASIKEISLNPVASPFAQKSVLSQKTAMHNAGEPGKVPEELQKILENEAENYKDQVQAYVDVCEILSKPGWQIADIVDYIHMLVRSVNLDVLSIVITDPSDKKKFLPVASRGFKSSPSAQVVSCWLPAISEEGTILWDELLEAAFDKKNRLAKWIAREGLNFVGYVPLHDNKKIYGFLLVAVASDKKAPSALASPLLELCGGRIGLVLESRRSIGSLPEKAAQTVKLVQDHLAMLTSYLEVLKISARINPEEVVSTADKCLKTIAESKKMIDLFADQVISTAVEKKD